MVSNISTAPVKVNTLTAPYHLASGCYTGGRNLALNRTAEVGSYRTYSSSGGQFLGRHEFFIRRLHSASGLWIGAYMCVHLLTNASVLNGAGTFQDQVETIHHLGRALPLVEWSLIFVPFIFHAVVGVQRAVSCETNSSMYRYGGNVRYTLQRVTAWIALFFIAWHVFHMHGWFTSIFG